MNTSYFIPTRGNINQRVPGVLAVAAIAGRAVLFAGTGAPLKPSAITDALMLKLADGAEGSIYFNFREVIPGTSMPLANLIFQNSDVLPVLVNTPVDIIQVLEAEVEGGDAAGDGLATHLITGGDANHQLAGNEATGQRLTCLGGKWGKYYPTNSATEAVYGRLIEWLSPKDAGNLRALIEVYPNAAFTV